MSGCNKAYEDQSGYKPFEEIDPSELSQALISLHLLGDDMFLSIQAHNLAIVDHYITKLESNVLRKFMDDERTPAEAFFLSAQSQMWIFATYELFRTWRKRIRNVTKWAEASALESKLETLERGDSYINFGKQHMAEQLRKIIDDPSLLEAIKLDQRRVEIPFMQLEAIRVLLAKHEIWRRNNSFASRPGYGRINYECGSLDYELEYGKNSFELINRRDIADALRKLTSDSDPPSDKQIASFKASMRTADIS